MITIGCIARTHSCIAMYATGLRRNAYGPRFVELNAIIHAYSTWTKSNFAKTIVLIALSTRCGYSSQTRPTPYYYYHAAMLL